MELNGLANLDILLQMTEVNGTNIDPELKAKLQEQIDLSVIYFKAWYKDNNVKWHEVRENKENYKEL